MVTITIKGQEYKLSKADTQTIERFAEWANTQLPDPMDEAREQVKGFPEALQLEIIRHAQKEKALRQAKSVQSEGIQAMYQTAQGVRKLFALVLQKHHGNLTDNDALKLMADCEEEHGISYLHDAFG